MTRLPTADRHASWRETLSAQLEQAGLPLPVKEHRFHSVRKWRFDLSYPLQKIAVEREGMVFHEGRHTRGSGFVRDLEKYNEAALLGWLLLRITGEMADDGRAFAMVKEALERRAI